MCILQQTNEMDMKLMNPQEQCWLYVAVDQQSANSTFKFDEVGSTQISLINGFQLGMSKPTVKR